MCTRPAHPALALPQAPSALATATCAPTNAGSYPASAASPSPPSGRSERSLNNSRGRQHSFERPSARRRSAYSSSPTEAAARPLAAEKAGEASDVLPPQEFILSETESYIRRALHVDTPYT